MIDYINMENTIAGSMNDNINMENTIAGSMIDNTMPYVDVYFVLSGLR
jgi:hypothetical protein